MSKTNIGRLERVPLREVWEHERKYRVAKLPDAFETGGIVGIAEITDCVKRHRSKWFQGPFGWTLAHARLLPFKPCKGQLKFFTPKF